MKKSWSHCGLSCCRCHGFGGFGTATIDATEQVSDHPKAYIWNRKKWEIVAENSKPLGKSYEIMVDPPVPLYFSRQKKQKRWQKSEINYEKKPTPQMIGYICFGDPRQSQPGASTVSGTWSIDLCSYIPSITSLVYSSKLNFPSWDTSRAWKTEDILNLDWLVVSTCFNIPKVSKNQDV